ncbi:MAG: hypothetical protein ACD_60C00018G0006 [uncultured bacterium]|nr:MAG: hypothetical protein ACD_60C00018G0006 [uncultured bacterium]
MKLFNLCNSDTTILTPNRRLAATWLKQFNDREIQQKKLTWPTLDILPIQSWLERLWHEYAAKEITNTFLLLSASQEAVLWEDILKKSPENNDLLQLGATAELAKSAFELLKLWNIDINHAALDFGEDSQAFKRWALEFKKICKKNNWLSIASLPAFLHKNLIENTINPPKKILLLGFTEIAPAYQKLLSACQERGSEIGEDIPEKSSFKRSIQKIALPDQTTEIYSMARFAKSIYDTNEIKPPHLIGCVVPSLETLRDTILRIFSDVFSENNTFTRDTTLLPFNISAGKNLNEFPVIKAALQFLKLNLGVISIETMSYFLRSPFLGEAEEEQFSRAYFDTCLRSANAASFSLKTFLSPHKNYSLAAISPKLNKRIHHYVKYIESFPKKRAFSEWAKQFIELLTLLGWPGERSLNSEEYQVTTRFLELLREYSTFDLLLTTSSFSEALHALTQLIARTTFQPETPDASIHIVGTLEAVGLPFQHLWVMGFDDTHWPAAPKPHPLIPKQLQKKLHMPHATSERELIYCKKLVTQLKEHPKNIIFSHAEKEEEMDLRPSPLLNHIDTITLDDIKLSDYESIPEKIHSKKSSEIFLNDIAPPINDTEIIHGGTAIFKQQAACPFKAFTELRLHARSLETPTLGLRNIERGNIMHKALELIWKIIKNSDNLKLLTELELKKLIQENVNHAIRNVVPDNLQKKYLLLEQKRLEKSLLEWLMLEKNRPAFNVIFQEHETHCSIGKIPLTLRIDRVDELNDGQYLIIDYKTGKNNHIKNWFSDRLDEPQLPLYCIANAEKTIGIAFGQLHADNMDLMGISKKNIDISSIKTLPEISYAKSSQWEQQLQEWKKTLESLSHDFQQGIATVDPKDRDQTCNHCTLHTFCRIYEQ